MIKTGEQHRESLRDGRHIYVNGASVEDVTRHPAFERSVTSVCRLFDFQSDPCNRPLMTYETADSRTLAHVMWQPPRRLEDLQGRRKALEAWAELHAGFLGRSPDHVASCITGMYMGLEVFEAYDPERAGALADYYRYARDNDLYLTYVIINPQADRSKSAAGQADPFLTAGIVDRDARG